MVNRLDLLFRDAVSDKGIPFLRTCLLYVPKVCQHLFATRSLAENSLAQKYVAEHLLFPIFYLLTTVFFFSKQMRIKQM